MGWQRWLSLDVISVQPIRSSFGWMDIPQLMDLGFINVLNAALLAQRI
jgi:hypothetical protein